jgi:hypothetical protein
MSEEMRRILDQAAETGPGNELRRLCLSCASFIAEIDMSSTDVAAYLEQRLGGLLLHARQHGGLYVFERACKDSRRLGRLVCKTGASP